MFQSVAVYCFNFSNIIPVSVVLGFYVSIIFWRFWTQFSLIPWPTSTSVFIVAYFVGDDERGRLMRRAIIRYVCLLFVLTMMSICAPVRKRFPSLAHITEAGRRIVVYYSIFRLFFTVAYLRDRFAPLPPYPPFLSFSDLITSLATR